MNPYASHLAGRDPLPLIAATAGELASFIRTAVPERAEQSPAPGKWSGREIICHLADCEIVFAYRLRQTLAENHHVIQPFDQDKWAANYGAYDAPAALAVFSSLRRWNIALIGVVPPEAFSKKAMHPERGETTFWDLVETMAGHDINHLKQLNALAARFAGAK
ncbi:MAG: DinB family protein [Candidatus Acidiferrales bacterium]